MAEYRDNLNKNLKTDFNNIHIRIHVFEPDESTNQEDWYKDMTTFKNMNIIKIYIYINIGDIVEDDTGARFRIISRHWKWDRDANGQSYPVLEFTAERYIRHGKQNPYMI